MSTNILVPPPETKTIIDKLAQKVAKNGRSFEQLILQHEQNNQKFNFLRFEDDPYRPYYQKKVEEESLLNEKEVISGDEELLVEDDKTENLTPIEPIKVQQAPAKKENEFQQLLREQIFGPGAANDSVLQRNTTDPSKIDFMANQEQVKPPPADQFVFTQGHPSSLANIDMDTIKLTAQFVARNGQKFLQGLTERENNNHSFDFLKPTHGLFGYFTTLVEQYSRLLMPRNELLQRYQVFADDSLEIMKAGGERHMYLQSQEEQKAANKGDSKKAGADEDIDWHDFVIVEQIDLYEDEDKATADAYDTSSQKHLDNQMQNQLKKQIQDNAVIATMPDPDEIEQQEEQEQVEEVPRNSGAALDPDLKVKKNYVRKGAKEEKSGAQGLAGSQKCPNCKQEILKSEWQQHFKICVLDSKWKEQKEQRAQRTAMNSLAGGDEISQNLNKFASQRPDLYGNSNLMESNAQAPQASAVQGNNLATAGPVWDGQSAHISRTTANVAMMRNQIQRNEQQAIDAGMTINQKPQPPTIQNSILQKDANENKERKN